MRYFRTNFQHHLASCNCMLRRDVNLKLEFRSAETTAKGLYSHTVFTSNIAFPWETGERLRWSLGKLMKPKAVSGHWASCSSEVCRSSLSSSNYEVISDLCATIIKPSSSPDWLGFIASEIGQLHRIRLMEYHQKLLDFKNIDTVSLAQVLRDKLFGQEQRSRLELNRRGRSTRGLSGRGEGGRFWWWAIWDKVRCGDDSAYKAAEQSSIEAGRSGIICHGEDCKG